MKLLLTIVILGLAVSGCNSTVVDAPQVSVPPVGNLPAPDRDTCGADQLQNWVGKPLSEMSALANIPQSARVYQTGSPLTLDLRPDRLNIEHDANSTIKKISCG